MEENKPFIITILVLIVLVLGLGGFIWFDKFVVEKNDPGSKIVLDDKSFDLNSIYKISDILDKFDSAFNDSTSSFCGYPYTQKKIEIENFNQEAALFAALHSEFIRTGTVQYVYGDIVKSNYETIFGKLKYNPAVSLQAGEGYQITYDTQSGNYAYVAPATSPYADRYEAINVSTKLIEDGLTITRKVFYVEFNNPNGVKYTTATLYTDNTKATRIGKVSLKNGVINKREIIAKYGSKGKSFQYTFKEKDSSNYYLASIMAV